MEPTEVSQHSASDELGFLSFEKGWNYVYCHQMFLEKEMNIYLSLNSVLFFSISAEQLLETILQTAWLINKVILQAQRQHE